MSDYDNQHEPGDVTVHSKTPSSNLDPADRPAGRPGRTGALDDIASSVKEFASRIPDSIGRALESAQTAITSRANAITIHVDDDAQRHIDQLVEAGIFKNRSESAAYLISEGIKARQDVFGRINSRFEEIERIRGEMRRMVIEPRVPDDQGPG
jgi:Arc/MetJ-type ribon-helix-helix transcriptional regulator